MLGKPAEQLTKDERDRAKAVNFGIIYGISSYGLSEQLGIEREEAQTYIDTYRGRMPRVAAFIEARDRDGARARAIRRRCSAAGAPCPSCVPRTGTCARSGERLAVNSVIQGSAADIIKIAMIRVHRRLRDEGLRARLVLQMHDELLLEVPETETSVVSELVRDEMIGAYDLDPPLAVDVGLGDDWLAAKE